MSPAKPKDGKIDASDFPFPSPINQPKSNRPQVELTPMLANTSDSDTEPASPAFCRIEKDPTNSIANPSYHKLFDKSWMPNGSTSASAYININPNNNLVEKSSRH